MSTRAIVVSGLLGSSLRPAAATPATRRPGSRTNSSAGTSSSSSRASVDGSRSEASGSRIFETGAIVARWLSNTQRTFTWPLQNRSVSPVLRIRSIRQSSAVRHQTRSWLRSPSTSARFAKASLSGTWRLPVLSTCPDQATPADCCTRLASSTALTVDSLVGRAATSTGTAIRRAAVTATISQRALTRSPARSPPRP